MPNDQEKEIYPQKQPYILTEINKNPQNSVSFQKKKPLFIKKGHKFCLLNPKINQCYN